MSEADPTEPTQVLFERAVSLARADATEEPAYWDTQLALQRADVNEVWDLVAPLGADPDPRLRALAPQVLRYLGGSAKPRLEETIALLREMLRVEQPPEVLVSVATAFVDLEHPAALDLLRPHLDHPAAEVREAIVHALMPIAEAAVPELIRLSRDLAPEVRNWATFALAQQLGCDPCDAAFVDTPELREALAARLDDPDACAEAAYGLALRGDIRALPCVERELKKGPRDDDWDESMYVQAAELLADPRLYPLLLALPQRERDVEAALAACRPRDTK